jgi:hypothetical protein
MKKILEAMDGAKAKAEVNSSDMKRFLQVVNESELNQPATVPLDQDPNFAKYTELMSKYDMLSAEMGADTSGLGIEKSASPEFVQQVNNLKAQADKLAGPNAQAWEQARKSGRAPQQSNAQLSTQLEDVGMSRLLSIVTESKDTKTNRLTTAESMTVNHYTEQKKTITTPVLNVQEGATPSMFGKYFKTVEQELKEAAERPNNHATQLAKRVIERVVGGEETPPGINRLTGKPIEPQAAPAVPTDAPAVVPLNKRFDPRFKNGPEPYTIDIDGTVYKFAGRDKSGPGTGEIIKVPAAVIGIRGLGAVSVELGKDGMYYPAPAAPIQEAEGEPEGVAHLTKELLTHIVQQSGKEGAHAVVKSLTWGDGAAKELLHLIINDLKDDIADMNEGLRDPKDNPCWKGYKPVGTKKKAGRTVPNCVPTSEAANAAQQAAIAIAKKKAGKK